MTKTLIKDLFKETREEKILTVLEKSITEVKEEIKKKYDFIVEFEDLVQISQNKFDEADEDTTGKYSDEEYQKISEEHEKMVDTYNSHMDEEEKLGEILEALKKLNTLIEELNYIKKDRA